MQAVHDVRMVAMTASGPKPPLVKDPTPHVSQTAAPAALNLLFAPQGVLADVPSQP